MGFLLLILMAFSCPGFARQVPDEAGLRSHAEVALGAATATRNMSIDPRLPDVIGTWLSRHFDLPESADPPMIAFSRVEAMAALRYGSAASSTSAGATADIVAIYVDADRTIYLPEGWTGNSPAELSMIVHEMVHHLQNQAGMKFACPEEREKVAYEAQQAWLALFGRDLSSDFGIDPFTVLVRTQCFY